jgi:hypothetical protein
MKTKSNEPMASTPLSTTEQMALDKALRLLGALKGVEYKIRGRGIDVSQWIEEEPREPRVMRNRGIVKYIRSNLPEILKPGQQIIIPATDEFDLKAIRSSATAMLGQQLGSGAYLSAISHEKNHIELLLV